MRGRFHRRGAGNKDAGIPVTALMH